MSTTRIRRSTQARLRDLKAALERRLGRPANSEQLLEEAVAYVDGRREDFLTYAADSYRPTPEQRRRLRAVCGIAMFDATSDDIDEVVYGDPNGDRR